MKNLTEKMRQTVLGLVCGVGLLAATQGSAEPAATNADTDAGTNHVFATSNAHKLAIGDQVYLQIVEDEDDPKPLVVMDSGDLLVPYLGPYPVVGMTSRELAATLKTELEKKYYKHATVIVSVNLMAKSRGRVYLNGAVQTPGPQEIPSDEVLTVSKAILRAGGLTDLADGKRVKVTKSREPGQPAPEPIIVNVEEIQKNGKTQLDIPLGPDDRIFVPDRLFHY